MSESSNNSRNWLMIVAIAAMFMMFGNGHIGIFHLNLGSPFFMIVIIVVAVWWINNGSGCCGSWGEDDCDDLDETEDDEEEASKE